MRGNRRGTGPVDFEALSAAKESNSPATTPTDPEQSDLANRFANVTIRTPKTQQKTVGFKKVLPRVLGFTCKKYNIKFLQANFLEGGVSLLQKCFFKFFFRVFSVARQISI